MTKSGDKTPRPLKKASILVIEDHTFVVDLLERMLKPRVGGLHGSRSAEDALYNLEKTPGLAHVALVDYHLLGMDGLKFIEKLRSSKNETLRRLPVIMLTGDNDMDLFRRAARLGISAFLIKPIAVDPLVAALEGALAGRKVPIPRLDGEPAPPSPDRPDPATPADDHAREATEPEQPRSAPRSPTSVNFKA